MADRPNEHGSGTKRHQGGLLSLVATPIGNLEDITLRGLRVLREADLVLAEDTRRTRQLLRAHGIENKVERLDDHVVHARLGETLERLRSDAHLALVSDAGTPLVSDPGALLVREAIAKGVRIEAVPGASAALAALLVSGVAAEGFRFVGFLPREGPSRQRALAAIARDPLPTVLFESPARTHETLRDLATACGGTRRAAMARELTKVHEEVARGTLDELAERSAKGVLGEVTLVVEGAEAPAEEVSQASVDQALDAAMAAGMRPSDAAREVARALGLKRAEVYQRALERSKGG